MLHAQSFGLAGALLLAVGSPTFGQSRVYELTSQSTEQTGCWAPCTCPLGEPQGMSGTFVVTPASPDPLFQHFTVMDVHWTYGASSVTGSGTYRLGGEVALQQQMTLDLSLNGGPVEHFDSGLVGPGPGSFPGVDLTLSMHNLYCFDTALHVNARPRSADWDGSGLVTVGDLFAYLSDWFAGNADFDGSGQTSVQDLFYFLAAWFAAGP